MRIDGHRSFSIIEHAHPVEVGEDENGGVPHDPQGGAEDPLGKDVRPAQDGLPADAVWMDGKID